jgi:hypothetical protein
MSEEDLHAPRRTMPKKFSTWCSQRITGRTAWARLRSLSFAKAGRVARRVSGKSIPALAIPTALNPEGSMQANGNDEDTPEEHHQIPDTEQSQLHLVR